MKPTRDEQIKIIQDQFEIINNPHIIVKDLWGYYFNAEQVRVMLNLALSILSSKMCFGPFAAIAGRDWCIEGKINSIRLALKGNMEVYQVPDNICAPNEIIIYRLDPFEAIQLKYELKEEEKE
jgi:hypothetical protein